MKFILFHILLIAILLVIGFSCNNKISDEYAGVITVFSIALGLYSLGFNILYHKNQRLYLFVNRIRYKLKRAHTFWQPHFHFELQKPNASIILSALWESLSSDRFGKAVKKEETANTLRVTIDNLFLISFRVTDSSVELYFGQKLLVPTHLYDSYRQKLARLAEEVRNIIKPQKAQYSIIVSFMEGEKNPYYGFFVNRVPVNLVQDFQVVFRLNSCSDCRIEASLNEVDIEGDNLTDTFEAMNQVLSLNALPSGGI